ncbi:ABC transporter permease [Paenibacillus aurantiacus]|uniref:ABC transporter permease n=1 Tax=Paenibacillus aurantiacus TaxID=1936118 RepID=A0ABV5KV67_9BACL
MNPVSWASSSEASTARAQTKQGRHGFPHWLHGWLVPFGILAIWETGAALGWISPSMLPAPSVIATAFWRLLISGELIHHLMASLGRSAGGFAIGASVGLFAGAFAGLGKWVERTLDPSLQMLRTIPLLALIPLFILWFGVGELAKWLLISLGAFFPVYFHTFLGVRGTDLKLYEVARTLRFSRTQLFARLILPAALPNILLGVRLSVGASWLLLAVAEMMGASEGVGYMIQDARVYAQTDIVFVGILIFALVGKLSDMGVRLLERRWLRWQDTYQG